MENNEVIEVSLDLTKILASGKVTTGGKENHQYVNLKITKKREMDNYGKDITVEIGLTKAEREAGQSKTYVGGGEIFVFNGQSTTPPPQTKIEPSQSFSQQQPDGSDDLPF